MYFYFIIYLIIICNLSYSQIYFIHIYNFEIPFLLSIIFPLLTLFGLEFVDLVNYIQIIILLFYFTCLFGFCLVTFATFPSTSQ